jgi:N-formylglutamate amidohydrolase
MEQAFSLVEPTTDEIPVVVEVPHAGLVVPSGCLAPLVAPARAIGRDADLHVDRLYADAPAVGATLLVGRLSRYVVDLNRGLGDLDPDVVEGARPGPRYNHGLVWRTTSDGDRALARPLTRAELDERLDLYYRPYHAALAAALERKRSRFGIAVLLAAHSMPSVGRSTAGAPGVARADVVPGTRGRTTASPRLIDAVERLARAEGWTVRHDEPYAGGFATQHYGRPAEGTHAVQVELSRRLYLDEATLRPRADSFDAVRGWCRRLVIELGSGGH